MTVKIIGTINVNSKVDRVLELQLHVCTCMYCVNIQYYHYLEINDMLFALIDYFLYVFYYFDNAKPFIHIYKLQILYFYLNFLD